MKSVLNKLVERCLTYSRAWLMQLD